MHNALWPFLISQVLLVLTDHQEEFAVSLAFERICSSVWYKFALTLGVVHSPIMICIFAARSPKDIVFKMCLKELRCIWLGWKKSTQPK